MSPTRSEAAAPPVIDIVPAAGETDIEDDRARFREYADFLDFSLCFQDFERELAELPGLYAPPAGWLWLARVDGAVAGCVGLRPYGEGKCEMKRLYLRDGARGLGLGRRLADLTVDAAVEIGYDVMRLDTAPKLATAIALYRGMGFVEVSEPQPEGAPTGLLVFEKRLRAEAG